ncbi:hypothetical protein ACET3Z_013129 [Daucus carota]
MVMILSTFAGEEPVINGTADGRSGGPKRRAGGAALNEFLENRLSSMKSQNSQCRIASTPLGTIDTNISQVSSIDTNTCVEGGKKHRGHGPSVDKIFKHIHVGSHSEVGADKENSPSNGLAADNRVQKRRGRGPGHKDKSDILLTGTEAKRRRGPGIKSLIYTPLTTPEDSNPIASGSGIHIHTSEQTPPTAHQNNSVSIRRRGRGPGINNIIANLDTTPYSAGSLAKETITPMNTVTVEQSVTNNSTGVNTSRRSG